MNNTIPTYIINLATSERRKQYMTDLLSDYSFLDISFIPAVDGRKMGDSQKEKQFDYAKSLKHYGRRLNDGEVGCALSHCLCYSRLLESDNKYALILEDDISIIRDLSTIPFKEIESLLDSERPRIIFMSGDYWRLSSKQVTKVYDAVGGYAFFLNRAAAQRALTIERPFTVADDWMALKRLGVQLYAVFPYVIDANLEMDTLSSDVKQYSWSNNKALMSKREVMKAIVPGIIKRVLKGLGMFESKVRVIDNKPVGR